MKTNHNFAALETTELWDINLSRKTRTDMYMSYVHVYPGTDVKKSDPNKRGLHHPYRRQAKV